eukprot:1157439-Pelagomonas_calceolata.AAC.5
MHRLHQLELKNTLPRCKLSPHAAPTGVAAAVADCGRCLVFFIRHHHAVVPVPALPLPGFTYGPACPCISPVHSACAWRQNGGAACVQSSAERLGKSPPQQAPHCCCLPSHPLLAAAPAAAVPVPVLARAAAGYPGLLLGAVWALQRSQQQGSAPHLSRWIHPPSASGRRQRAWLSC